ncbi:protein FAR1-RELATED SEQUENCE 5-like [Rutidosis leptorrhynchoides]|uniref:protein FAR1-RELATED SEQUENCE 5-like n=1 Tax=Rutidosis leptorrhynchoides TaxID=125765 RepID=UPI003A996780
MDLNNNLQLVDVGTINSNGIADVQEDVQDVNSQEKIQGFSRNDDLCFTPNGTRYYVPNVPVECKPVEGSLWNSIDEALAMYENYAKIAGFTVRKSTTKSNADGEYKLRYLLCNREGQPKNNMAVDTLKEQPISKQPNGDGSNAKDKVPRKKRNSNFIVCGCTARIKLKYIKSASCFELYGFEESHNHELVTDENKHLTRAQRQLQFEDQIFFHLVGMNNIGPTKAHRLRAFLKGGYDKVHGTVVDWKNHKRDLNSFIGEYDAQMLLDKFESRKLNCPEFSFEFKADKDELVGLFWADETSKCNYREFGDVLAFDATYRTNKYCMIFVPFTGIDHHNKCVTFGAGLIKHEDIESYSWLLKAFLKAHIKQPTLVLTLYIYIYIYSGW